MVWCVRMVENVHLWGYIDTFFFSSFGLFSVLFGMRSFNETQRLSTSVEALLAGYFSVYAVLVVKTQLNHYISNCIPHFI